MIAQRQMDTNVLFSGGAGIFCQYYDIIKPVYLYAILRMIITKEDMGFPVNILSRFSNLSMIEWYLKRRYINPLKCLDYNHQLSDDKLDDILRNILRNDDSLYKLTPMSNMKEIFDVYKRQHMTFPVYVYSEYEEPNIKKDCNDVFKGIKFKYFFGDLRECIKTCGQNFTYIFSDIDLVRKSAEILSGSCSNILLARDYRYNFIDNCRTPKYDLNDISTQYPYARIGTIQALNVDRLAMSFSNLTRGGI